MTPKLFATIAIKGAVLGGAICNLVFTFYFEHWLKREREKAERFAEKRNCSDYYRYNGNSVCTLCTGISILCILLIFLSTALR